MIDVAAWLTNKFGPIPHANELRGLSLKEMERKLHRELGYSQSQAKRFVWLHKSRLRG